MITLILLGFMCVFVGFLWWYNNIPKENLPPAYPGKLPVIGHAHLLLGDGKHLWNFICNLQKHCLENGGVTHIKLGSEIYYVICDAEDYITATEACLEKNYIYQKFLSSWVGQGLVTASVPVWKRHQKLLYPSFGQAAVDKYAGIHNTQARKLVEKLASYERKGSFELGNHITKSAFEANFQTTFGLELDEDTTDQMETYLNGFVEIRRVMTKRIQSVWMHSDILYRHSALKKRQDDALKTTNALSDLVIKKKRMKMNAKAHSEHNPSNNGKRLKGTMDLLLELSAEGMLTDEEIRWQVDTMLLAGYYTSSTSTAMVCTILGSYPEVQEKVYKELQEVFGGSDRDVERDDLSKLVYLDAVVKEVGRLYPAAPIIARYVDKDVKLRGYTMPTGSNCVMIISGINRHAVWGPDREQFRPERWLDASALPDHANAFTGFSTGRRACLGKPYAINYMKITLAHLLRRYRFTADHTKLVMELAIFHKPADGFYVTMDPRNVSA